MSCVFYQVFSFLINESDYIPDVNNFYVCRSLYTFNLCDLYFLFIFEAKPFVEINFLIVLRLARSTV